MSFGSVVFLCSAPEAPPASPLARHPPQSRSSCIMWTCCLFIFSSLIWFPQPRSACLQADNFWTRGRLLAQHSFNKYFTRRRENIEISSPGLSWSGPRWSWMPVRFQEDKGLERMLVGDTLQGRGWEAPAPSHFTCCRSRSSPYLLRQRETCTPNI